jgi:hypothetical protein
VEYCEREVDQAGRQAYACACISVLGQTTRRRLPIAGRLRASERERRPAALLAALPAMGGPDRDGCLLPVADDVADVLPCAGLL